MLQTAVGIPVMHGDIVTKTAIRCMDWYDVY